MLPAAVDKGPTACRPSLAWPTSGAIHVTDLVVRYRPDLPPVLKGISFKIGAREKVGICGRTGCGKSTLMLTLYRIVEPSSGSIKIDGIEATSIGLYDLRSRLSLVPQVPRAASFLIGQFRGHAPLHAASDEQRSLALCVVSRPCLASCRPRVRHHA